jgi:ribosomal protein S18 acetylase RimI-like enzyme
MRKANREDKDRVVGILVKSFENDPYINWLIKSGKKHKQLNALMNLAFEEIFLGGEVYLTDDETGVALWKRNRTGGVSLANLLSKVRFAYAFGWRKMVDIVKMERYVKSRHPKDDFLYLWFVGVLPEDQRKGNANELLDPVLKNCEKEKLPVYLQTANPQNVKIYERKGFEVFHEWSLENESALKVWFMRKVC